MYTQDFSYTTILAQVVYTYVGLYHYHWLSYLGVAYLQYTVVV